jgi:quinol-cytochrome oxidoreductase complex cytochrome b subunit
MVFLAFYAILRAFTVDFILEAKLWGVLAMFAAILLLFFLPWIDRSPVRSGNYRPAVQAVLLDPGAGRAGARLGRRQARRKSPTS